MAKQRGRLREHVFLCGPAYVTAWTDTDETVVLYSITTASPEFKPTFDLPPFTLTLGVTTFADLGDGPEEIRAFLGARRVSYHERYYLGNPGLYLEYIVGFNDAETGLPKLSAFSAMFSLNGGPLRSDVVRDFDEILELLEDDRVKAFRSEATINTLSIGGFGFNPVEDEVEFGPDQDQLRILAATGGYAPRMSDRLWGRLLYSWMSLKSRMRRLR